VKTSVQSERVTHMSQLEVSIREPLKMEPVWNNDDEGVSGAGGAAAGKLPMPIAVGRVGLDENNRPKYRQVGIVNFYRFQYGKSVNNQLELGMLGGILRPLIEKIAFLSFLHLMGIKWDILGQKGIKWNRME